MLPNAPARENLGLAVYAIEDDAAALSAAQAYLAIEPQNASAHKMIAEALKGLGDPKGAVAASRSGLELTPNDLQSQSVLMFMLNYLDETTAQERMDVASAFHRNLAQSITPFRHRPIPTAVRRELRIGMVSGDLKEHSVSQFLLAVLPELRARGLHLTAYQTLPKTDAVTAQLRPMFDTWRDITEATDENAAAQIRSDEIDILIDLAGHTKGARPRLFAMRPAPLAVSWLGYSGTTGNPGIDYILCNNLVLPPEHESYFTERPLRLPGPFLCFAPPKGEAPAPDSTKRVAFGSFNALNKVGDRTVALWSRILTAVPDSDLILKSKALASEEVRAATAQRFAAHGIDAARITMIDWSPSRQAHLALYGRLSLALDTWPYAGTTTTMEALCMGVPVLTLNEGSFISRVSASILSAAGLDAWIAADEDDYVSKAVAAAADVQRLIAIRPTIRSQVVGSALCDAVAFGANFARAMREIWRHWCIEGTVSSDEANLSRSG